MEKNGTPKTLLAAICNGIPYGESFPRPTTIERHVRDFLAQKFGAAMLAAGVIESEQVEQLLATLYKNITGHEVQR